MLDQTCVVFIIAYSIVKDFTYVCPVLNCLFFACNRYLYEQSCGAHCLFAPVKYLYLGFLS
jgi:hypothetical protein